MIFNKKYIKIDSFQDNKKSMQKHVHEIHGNVVFSDGSEMPHQHRIATISDEAWFLDTDDHIHEVCFKTDYANGHYHEFRGKTSGAITIGEGHIHYIEAYTTSNNGHLHRFKLITMIIDNQS